MNEEEKNQTTRGEEVLRLTPKRFEKFVVLASREELQRALRDIYFIYRRSVENELERRRFESD